MMTNFLKNRNAKWILPAALLVTALGIGWFFSHDNIIEDRVAPPTLNRLSLKPGGDFKPMVPLKNESKQPGVFSATLTAAVKNISSRPHRIFQQATSFMLYNGYLPGPLIEVDAGDHVKIKFINKLAKETTVHFHGLPIPSDQDGNPMDAVPREKSRLYDFVIPLGTEGGYWYHPHPEHFVAAQAAAGLAGAMIVRSKDDPLKKIGIPEDNIFINGLRLANGQIDKDDEMDWQHGRMGETLLVNGVVQPVLTVKPGSTHRLRFWNATNGRFITLSLKKGTDPNAPDVKTYLVGTDGGLINRPFLQADNNGMMLSSAERREVVARFDGKPGDVYTLFEEYPKLPERAMSMDIGNTMGGGDMAGMDMGNTMGGGDMAGMDMGNTMGGGSSGGMDTMPGMEVGVKKPLMTIKLSSDAVERPVTLPNNLRVIKPLPETPIKKRMEFTGVLADVSINGKKFDMKRVDYFSKKGTVEEWSIVNRSDMTHPIHVHGGQFQVVRRELNGVVKKPPYISWQDTVAVMPDETVVLRMKQDFSGIRMIHCHILEHEEKGMMATINVVE